MIRYCKYNAKWELIRNGFNVRQCTESAGLIWPFQKVYHGIGNITWPIAEFWIKPKYYLLLKIKDEL